MTPEVMSHVSGGHGHEVSEPSTEILLAEHARLSNLYLYNTDLGEKRIASYITLISVAGGSLIALTQLQFKDIETLIELSAGIVGGISMIGLLTFYRLIERRIRSVEYLRAINRIHAYFVQQDAALEPHFHWPPNDDFPPFVAGISDMAALRDVIQALNGLFTGVLAALLTYLVWKPSPMPLLVALGLVVTVFLWFAQQSYEKRSLLGAEEEARSKVKFPLRHAK